MGLDEQLFDSGVCVIEWAERAEDLLPEDSLWLEFSYGETDEGRRIVLDCKSLWFDELLVELKAGVNSFSCEEG